MTTERNDAVYNAYLNFGDLVRGGTVTPAWNLGGPSFWYAEGGPQDRVIHLVDPVKNSREPLFDVDRLRKALTTALGFEPAGNGVPFAQLAFIAPQVVMFAVEGKSFTLDLTTYQLTEQQPPLSLPIYTLLADEVTRATPRLFPKEGFAGLGKMNMPESPSPDGKWFASVLDNNIALRATVDGQTVLLTNDGTEQVSWDVETVKWQAWSPDAQRLAVMRVDTTDMARIPTVHWLKPLEQVTEVITIPAGGVLNRNELFVLNVQGGRPVQIDLGDTTDQYLVVLGWLPHGRELLVARYDRLFTQVEILAASPVDGSVRSVMTEKSATWLTNQHYALWATDTGFWLLPDGSGFLWRSERDGWAHLYHYDIQGNLVGQLTQGAFPVISVTTISDGYVYFQAHADTERPYDNHLYRVPLAGGASYEQLTEGKGRHTIAFAPVGGFFVGTFSSVDAAPVTVLRSVDGKLLQTLSTADIALLEQTGYTPSKEFVVKAADGETDLWATLHYPYDFDPSQKYPLVESIYGGPQTTWRTMDLAAQPRIPGAESLLNHPRALTAHGFLVLTLDGRGTPGRSKAFHDTIYRNWGNFEIADHAGAIKQLAERESYIDLERVGIMGGSWGGHYTFRALVQAPDVYKAGIAEMPGLDSRAFTLYEVYLGLPADNAELYDNADVLRLAPQLTGDLLLIGGANDTGTQKDFFRMSEALIRAGIQHDAFTYPNTGHGALGASGRYNNELKLRWLKRHL